MLATLLVGMSFVGCKENVNIHPVSGTMEEAVQVDSVPAMVREVLTENTPQDLMENILNDEENRVGVWSLMQCAPDVSAEGFGILVVKNGVSTALPELQHGRNPQAWYDDAQGVLWLTCGVMEGTGVAVEELNALRFDDNGQAYVAWTLNPYDVQQTLCERLSFSVSGNDITFYDNKKKLATVTNTVTDRGNILDDAVWIGEQIGYELGADGPMLCVVPGLNFTTGLVLSYDDMPTLTAHVTPDFANGSYSIEALSVRKEE